MNETLEYFVSQYELKFNELNQAFLNLKNAIDQEHSLKRQQAEAEQKNQDRQFQQAAFANERGE